MAEAEKQSSILDVAPRDWLKVPEDFGYNDRPEWKPFKPEELPVRTAAELQHELARDIRARLKANPVGERTFEHLATKVKVSRKTILDMVNGNTKATLALLAVVAGGFDANVTVSIDNP